MGPSALLSANTHIVLLIAKPLNLNVTGNAINPLALNPSANLFAKTPTVSLKLNAAHVPSEHPKLLNLSHSSKKPKNKRNVANAKNKKNFVFEENDLFYMKDYFIVSII